MLGLLGLSAEALQGASDRSSIFAIPETRDARTLMESALEHVHAKRWNEAITALQRLIDAHRGDVLPARMQDDTGRLSNYAFHTGAAAWATQQLTGLPVEARKIYRSRHEKKADELFRSAHREGNRRALAEVALRWPLTDSAESAWWTLGDLEMEIGNVDDAEHAWVRANEVSALAGKPASAGGRERLAMAERLLSTRAADDRTARQLEELRLPGTGEGGGPVPEDFADAWNYSLPKSPFRDRQWGHNLFPVLAGDTVYLSTSWQMLAFDAYTGELAWESPELAGWTVSKRAELVRGIDRESVMIAPAVSGSVVVAPIQVPHSRLGYTDFQGIRITVPIPERRLFAFDRTTGKSLWDHSPPPVWDGESGSYAQRMVLAGPPVAAGSRVLVPCYLMQGRVDFHVACYDLASGERLWSTPLVSGQRPLNMFGRHEQEFCAPPLRIEGERAIALTQLGTVVALDLYTGSILWQALYEQIPLPTTRGWHTQHRPQYWRNAPPVVADGAVIATPTDSDRMVAFDIENGTVLWSYPHVLFGQSAQTGEGAVNVLLGADKDTVYVGGGRIAAFHSPAGLSSMSESSKLSPAWYFDAELHDDMNRTPRAVLGRDEILLSTRKGRIAIDKLTGLERRRNPLPWAHETQSSVAVGNVLIGNGMLFTASAERLSGLFDWNILEGRAQERIEANPNDIAAMLTLAQVREQHGVLLYQTGDVRGALGRLSEARALLQPNIADRAHGPEVAERLHRVLRTEARARETLADAVGALLLLDAALPLAPTTDDLRDTLLQKEELVRDRDLVVWHETLDELGDRCDGKTMPRGAWAPVLEDPLGGPPSAAYLSRDDLTLLEDNLPVGLWVYLMRARAYRESGEATDELEELHACLSRYGAYPLSPGRTAFELVSARIDDLLAEAGRRPYERFEKRAAAMVADALSKESTRDLEMVRRLYPQSIAAREVGDLLLDAAYAEGNVDRVCQLVLEALSTERVATLEDARRLSLLAEMLGRAGNLELERGLLTELARDYPDLEVRGGTRSDPIRRRLEDLPGPPTAESERPMSSFGATLGSVGAFIGSFFRVGFLPPGPAEPEAPSPSRLVLLREVDNDVILEIHSSDDPVAARPFVALRMNDAHLFRTALSPTRVFLSDGEDLVVLDAETGGEGWPSTSLPRGWQLLEMRAHDGVLVVLLESPEGNCRAMAFDAHGGRELWDTYLPRGPTWRAPVFDAARAVFLTQSHSWQLPARALVIDLYRGVQLGEIDLGGPLSADSYDSSFAQDGVLVLPSFHMASTPDRNRVVGYDLERMTEVWSHPFTGGRELDALVQHDGKTYLIVTPGDDASGGAIVQLDPRLGATRPVMQLRAEDRVMGVARHRRQRPGPTRIEAPFLFFYTARAGLPTTAVTAVHLLYGKRWTCSLRVPYDELYDVGMALPGVSTDTIAVAYTKKNRSKLPGETYLTLIDRDTGMKRGDLVLATALGHADDLELVGLGDALFILSRDNTSGSPMEVWETRR